MSWKEPTSENTAQAALICGTAQYAPWQIVGLWLAGGTPVWLLSWVAAPLTSAGLPPALAAGLRSTLLMLGLVWQLVLALWIVYYEEGDLGLDTVRRRLRLNHPLSPRTGQTQKALWWWIVPLLLLALWIETGLGPSLAELWAGLFPALPLPPGEGLPAAGAWQGAGLFLAQSLFKAFLGEEFLFRGVLLPRMQGVFGKWDWAANGALYGLYHLYQPWAIPAALLSGMLFAFSAKRFHSSWFPILLHAAQVAGALVLSLV